jgi:hypothetical protein
VIRDEIYDEPCDSGIEFIASDRERLSVSYSEGGATIRDVSGRVRYKCFRWVYPDDASRVLALDYGLAECARAASNIKPCAPTRDRKPVEKLRRD